MLVILLFAALFNTGLVQLILLIGLTGWMPVARLARGAFREMMTLPYVEAARASGADGTRIVGRHLVPNALGVLFVAALAQVNRSILAFLLGDRANVRPEGRLPEARG